MVCIFIAAVKQSITSLYNNLLRSPFKLSLLITTLCFPFSDPEHKSLVLIWICLNTLSLASWKAAFFLLAITISFSWKPFIIVFAALVISKYLMALQSNWVSIQLLSYIKLHIDRIGFPWEISSQPFHRFWPPNGIQLFINMELRKYLIMSRWTSSQNAKYYSLGYNNYLWSFAND